MWIFVMFSIFSSRCVLVISTGTLNWQRPTFDFCFVLKLTIGDVKLHQFVKIGQDITKSVIISIMFYHIVLPIMSITTLPTKRYLLVWRVTLLLENHKQIRFVQNLFLSNLGHSEINSKHEKKRNKLSLYNRNSPKIWPWMKSKAAISLTLFWFAL